MQKYKSKVGRQRIQYSYTGKFDGWVTATMDYMGSLMPPTLTKRAAAMLLLVAGMGNEEIVELTGMCIRSVRALRKTMEEQEPTAELFAIKPGSGRKKKTEGIEGQVWGSRIQTALSALPAQKMSACPGCWGMKGTLIKMNSTRTSRSCCRYIGASAPNARRI